MPRYEYKTIEAKELGVGTRIPPTLGDPGIRAKFLAELGRDGWLMCGTLGNYLFFVRDITVKGREEEEQLGKLIPFKKHTTMLDPTLVSHDSGTTEGIPQSGTLEGK